MAAPQTPKTRSETPARLVLGVTRRGESYPAGWTVDLSATGIKIAGLPRARSGERVHLALSFPHLLQPLHVAGTVVWTGCFDRSGRSGCGVRVLSERHRSRLRELLRVDHPGPMFGEPIRVLVAGMSALHQGVEAPRARERCVARAVELELRDQIMDARKLRLEVGFDIVLVDAALLDKQGAHVLGELMIGEGTPYAGAVVATVRDENAATLAEQLGCDTWIRHPLEIAPWIETADLLACQRIARRRARVDFV